VIIVEDPLPSEVYKELRDLDQVRKLIL
jgi:predicted regulator of amino acid metabolism with ACT domain